ncbi:Quinol monooxygenase YgiN [Chitinophaga sp. YR573]|uniref:putative quinol monooxygenase n=1 Tax=Chitinophaga sp. YR573 TaxID=1881040 RepID=UPI0008BA2BBA|nr:putative quinol monooxygenase [Chitinophaga sp. YR573]SEW42921.1 Quinol monooxygenase YgiN [Chitinophaga sp. YR573]
MNEIPVYTFAKWQVKEGQLDSVLKLLTEVAEQSSKEEGNLFYKIHQSKSDANTLILFEGYTNETALEGHRNSEHFKTLVIGKIIPKLENREVIITSQLIPD